MLPYSFDTNDMHYHQGFHRFVTARDFAEYTTDAFDTLWAEGERQPKMMSIGLHLRMIGRPGRIAALDRIVGHMKQKGGAWFATRRQIAEHWLEVLGLLRPHDLDGRGGVHDQPALLVLEVAVEKADRAAPAQHPALGDHVPGPIASKKLILSSSVGTATASLPLAMAALAIAVSTMPVRKPPWQIVPWEWQKAGTISKRKRADAALRIDVEQLAVQQVARLGRLPAQRRRISASLSEVARRKPAKSGWTEFI